MNNKLLASTYKQSFFNEQYLEVFRYPLVSPTGLLFININNFKYLKSTLGYFSGNKLSRAIYEALSSLLNLDSSIYNLGEDEFIIIITGLENISQIEELAIRMIQRFQKHLKIDDKRIYLTLSIGASFSPEHGSTIEELIRSSHIATITGQSSGINKCIFYEKQMLERISRVLDVREQLRFALKNNEFTIHYQPQLDLITDEVCGLEALLRWNNPVLGSVPPDEFIEIAEQNFSIIPIGEWVLRNSCYFLKELHNKGHEKLTISVNISIHQLLQDNFSDNIIKLLEYLDLDPKYLNLEITESLLRQSYDVIIKKINHLKSLGIRISLDDFGKGYSSLSELQKLPVDILKIDKAFIDMITSENKHKNITDLIIIIAHKMNMSVVAEGVETQEQLDYLKDNKCDQIQGYLYSKPLAGDEIMKMLPAKTHVEPELRSFPWKPEYAVNIKEIDRQHQKLFEIGHRTYQLAFACKKTDYEDEYYANQINSIISELTNYAKYHFQYEENLMEKHGYVHFQTHKTEHDEFFKQLEDLKKNNSEVLTKQYLINLLDFVFLWITDHILTIDQQYKGLLKD